MLFTAAQELSPYLFMLGGGAVFLLFVAVILMAGGNTPRTNTRHRRKR